LLLACLLACLLLLFVSLLNGAAPDIANNNKEANKTSVTRDFSAQLLLQTVVVVVDAVDVVVGGVHVVDKILLMETFVMENY